MSRLIFLILSLPAAIIGDGNKFTVCCPFTTNKGTIRQAYIVSGEVGNGAINNLYRGYVFYDLSDEVIVPKDGDAVSPQTTWPLDH